METLDMIELKALVVTSPIKEIRGRFRFNLPFGGWNFGSSDDSIIDQESILKKFLEDEKPWIIFETEKGEKLGKFIIEYDLFDGDPPTRDNEVLFFSLPIGNKDPIFLELFGNEPMLLSLFIEEDWPYYSGGGKFSVTIEIN